MAGKCTAIKQTILQLLFCSHTENGGSAFFRNVGKTYPARWENQNRIISTNSTSVHLIFATLTNKSASHIFHAVLISG
jgi:hypothetical protein